jgi:two-component system, OmpR family, alkaline phosphatase synthesis response regulator PhoP
MAKSVWIVDDEPLIRAAMLAVLGEVGYEARGFDAAGPMYVALVDGERPDLLILDHMLPDESGSTIVRSLRERVEYQDIPVLFVTAVSDDDAERLSDLAPVLTKPFDFRDFLGAVREQLGETDSALADSMFPASEPREG